MKNFPLILYHDDSINNEIEIRTLTISNRNEELHVVITFKEAYDLTQFKTGDKIEVVSSEGNAESRNATFYNIQVIGELESVGKDFIIIKPMDLNK